MRRLSDSAETLARKETPPDPSLRWTWFLALGVVFLVAVLVVLVQVRP